MLDALRPSWVIIEREVRDQFRDWRIIFPIIGLTLVFPFIMNWTAKQMLDFTSEYGASVIADRLVPFLLMVVGFFPISVSLVIALESFVGEKERSSIEPLLNTPLKDWQLYLGKLVASTVPPLVSSYLGMTVYLSGLAIRGIALPEAAIMIQVVLLTTVQAVMMVAGAVVVSTQATSVRAANLLASFIIIPVAFLVQWEALVMFWGNLSTLWWVLVGLVVLTALLVRVGLAHFQREELLGREIDVLKFRWAWSVFCQAFTGGARSLPEWYRQVISSTLRRLALPAGIAAALALVGFMVGMQLVERYPLISEGLDLSQAGGNLNQLLEIYPLLGAASAFGILWQNLRVLLLALVMGIFTFGVLGVLPLFATMGVAGFLSAALVGSGLSIWSMTALLLPHGLLEIPAAVLATAAVLEAGAILATPTPGKTIGEVWISTVADWAKIMLGLVLPMLVVASLIEVFITPRIALMLFGG